MCLQDHLWLILTVQHSIGNHKGAVKSSTTVIELEPGNIKALYRRASAYKELTQYANSAKDLKVHIVWGHIALPCTVRGW